MLRRGFSCFIPIRRACGFRLDEAIFKDKSVYVILGAANDNGDLASAPNIADELGGFHLERIGSPRFLLKAYPAQQVVRDAALLFDGDLVGDDRESPVHLHGIGIDDLSVQPTGQVDGELRGSSTLLL